MCLRLLFALRKGKDTMTQIYPTIRTMTFEEAREFGYCHQGLMMEHNCVSYRLSAGTKDNLHTFANGVVLYVLTLNQFQEYVALDYYIGHQEDVIDGVMFQGAAISEVVGRDWRSLTLIQLTKRLLELFA